MTARTANNPGGPGGTTAGAQGGTAPSRPNETNTRGPRGTHHETRSITHLPALLAGVLAIVALFTWFQWRTHASSQDTYSAAAAQLARMQADADRIRYLRTAPKSASARERGSEELLAGIETALREADINVSHWRDSIPQPPVRLPKSDYRLHGTRIYLDGLTLRELAAFTCHLERADASLSLSSLAITNREPDIPTYDADLAITYRVFAPGE